MTSTTAAVVLSLSGITLAGVTCLDAARIQSFVLDEVGSNNATRYQESRGSTTSSPQRVLLDRYCVVCHNERLRTAGLMLDKMRVEDVSTQPEIWEKVVSKL